MVPAGRRAASGSFRSMAAKILRIRAGEVVQLVVDGVMTQAMNPPVQSADDIPGYVMAAR